MLDFPINLSDDKLNKRVVYSPHGTHNKAHGRSGNPRLIQPLLCLRSVCGVQCMVQTCSTTRTSMGPPSPATWRTFGERSGPLSKTPPDGTTHITAIHVGMRRESSTYAGRGRGRVLMVWGVVVWQCGECGGVGRQVRGRTHGGTRQDTAGATIHVYHRWS